MTMLAFAGKPCQKASQSGPSELAMRSTDGWTRPGTHCTLQWAPSSLMRPWTAKSLPKGFETCKALLPKLLAKRIWNLQSTSSQPPAKFLAQRNQCHLVALSLAKRDCTVSTVEPISTGAHCCFFLFSFVPCHMWMFWKQCHETILYLMACFNISNHQITSSYVCFCSCQWCGMAQSVF